MTHESRPWAGSRVSGASGEDTNVRILIADDEVAVRDALGRALTSEGYEVAFARDGHEALIAVERDEPDAAVLDVMMPPPDGLEVCRQLRSAENAIPILMLTARREVSDRVAGLDAGADDYLPKPFALDELLARLRALLRRVPEGGGQLSYADVVVDPLGHRAWRAERRLDLTRTEFALLELFVRVGRARAHALRDPRRRLGLRLRPDVELARGLRRLPATQARGGRPAAPDPDGPRRRLRDARGTMTIGKRVILATSAALVTVVVLLSVFAYQLVKRELYSRIDVTLRTRATELTPDRRRRHAGVPLGDRRSGRARAAPDARTASRSGRRTR